MFTILLYSWKLLAEKEEQQTEFIKLKEKNDQLEKEQETLLLANESHLDTITFLENVRLNIAVEHDNFAFPSLSSRVRYGKKHYSHEK